MTNTRQWMRQLSCAAVVVVGMASAAGAQQDGLVNVNLENVKIEIAEQIKVDVSQIPVNVQAPIGVAANVCNVDANVLAEQKKQGEASCTAEQTSTALNQLVQKQVRQ